MYSVVSRMNKDESHTIERDNLVVVVKLEIGCVCVCLCV